MRISEKHFNTILGVIVSSVVGYLLLTKQITVESIIGMGGAIGFNVILLLTLGFSLQYFQFGTKKNVQEEIFDNKNIAVAIYQVGIWIALAMVISKSLI